MTRQLPTLPQRKDFQLPMTITFAVCEEVEGDQIKKVSAHALDFDLVSVAPDRHGAMEKLRLAVKTYVEYGLANGWSSDIRFPAPEEFWARAQETSTVAFEEPIFIEGIERLQIVATGCEHHDRPEAVLAEAR